MLYFNCNIVCITVIICWGDDKMIFVDNKSRVPIYEQIKEQIVMLVNTGIYKPGDRLPSIRNLSNQLNINVNTIKHSYAQLETEGVINSVQGKGVFIAENPLENEQIVKGVLDDLDRMVRSAMARGVSKEQIKDLIDRIYETGENYDKY